MKQIKNYKTTTYEEELFNIEIVETPTMYEAWLWHCQYGIKSMMFGVPKEQNTRKKFLEIVKNNLPEYIDDYEEVYCR